MYIARSGLGLMESHRFGPIDWLRKAVTDNWSMALKEIESTIIGKKAKEFVVSATEYSALLNAATAETHNNASIWIDIQVVIARRVGVNQSGLACRSEHSR